MGTEGRGFKGPGVELGRLHEAEEAWGGGRTGEGRGQPLELTPSETKTLTGCSFLPQLPPGL